MAIIILKTMMAITIVTPCNIMLFAEYGEALFLRIAGGGAADPSRTQLLGNYCKILEEIFSKAHFECVIEMSAQFGPHNDPSPVRIVLIKTTFFLIQTPFALTQTPFFLTTTRFALTTT
ncbi:MAG: hypothetical protein A2V67_08320 [Deltaproteobacteria bacterium RBG_13_61_14]|nr:MAG: hypothetical protein A2V67_08320 [Deltaproteobacteria bacterium RBG_13_61_14]